jgi:hypothetical protein
MASIPELLPDHVTREVECLDRLYLNGYIGRLATSGGLVTFMQQQLGGGVDAKGSVHDFFSDLVLGHDRVP